MRTRSWQGPWRLRQPQVTGTLIRQDPLRPGRHKASDIGSWPREIAVRGKGSKARVAQFGRQAALSWTATSGWARHTSSRGGRSCGWE